MLQHLFPPILTFCLLCIPAYSTESPHTPSRDSKVHDDSLLYRDAAERFAATAALLFPNNDSSLALYEQSLPAFTDMRGNTLPFVPLRYNRAEGLLIGLGDERRVAFGPLPQVYLHGGLAYAFAAQYWQAFGGIAWRIGTAHSALVLGADARQRTESADTWKISGTENSIFALLAREDALDYYRHNGVRLYAEYFHGAHWHGGFSYGSGGFAPLARNAAWSLFGGGKSFREQPDFPGGRSTIATLFAEFRTPALANPGSAAAHVHGMVETGRGDFDFERAILDAGLRSATGTFRLAVALRMAATRGHAPPVYYYRLGGVGAMDAYGHDELRGNRMLLLHGEIAGQAPGLDGTHFLSNLSLIVFGRAAYTGNAAPGEQLYSALFPHNIRAFAFSPGLALGGRNGRWRIGAVWRSDISAPPRLLLRLDF